MPYNTSAVPSAARTASGDSGALTFDSRVNSIRVQLNVSAVAGTTPTLDVIVEDTLDGGATWNSLVAFTQATAVTRQVTSVLPTATFSDSVRVRWTVAGLAPSFTFSVVLFTEV